MKLKTYKRLSPPRQFAETKKFAGRLFERQSLGRILQYYTTPEMAVTQLTSWRSDPLEKSYEENIRDFEALKKQVRQEGLGFQVVLGGYPEEGKEHLDPIEELSLVVVRPKNSPMTDDEFLEFALEVCRRYNQDSALIKLPFETPKLIDRKGNVIAEFKKPRMDMIDTYYTRLTKGRHKGRTYYIETARSKSESLRLASERLERLSF